VLRGWKGMGCTLVEMYFLKVHTLWFHQVVFLSVSMSVLGPRTRTSSSTTRANPIYTSPRNLPPSQIQRCKVTKSIISHGCFLKDCVVNHCIVGIRSRLESGVELTVSAQPTAPPALAHFPSPLPPTPAPCPTCHCSPHCPGVCPCLLRWRSEIAA